MKSFKIDRTRVLLVGLGSLAFLLVNWPFLTGKLTFVHDTIYWSSAFHYFADGLRNGFLPIWNPYVHAGDMFVENFTQESYIDPVTLAVIALGSLFRVSDLMALYGTSVLVKIAVLAAGIQLLLNHLLPELKRHWPLTYFTLLLGSFAVNGFHQNGSFLCMGYLPFVLYFFLRAEKTPTWQNYIGMSYFLGVSLQTAVFAYQAVALMIFLALRCFFAPREALGVFRHPAKIALSLLLFLALSAPALSLFHYSPLISPYARTIFNPHDDTAGIFFQSASRLLESLAAFGKPVDLVTAAITPYLWVPALRDWHPELLSEMNFYLGWVPFLFAVHGIRRGQSPNKRLLLAFLFASIVLYFGPQVRGLYDMLFFALLPLRAIENTHTFAGFVFIGYVYFIALGIVTHSRWKKHLPLLIILTWTELSAYQLVFVNRQSQMNHSLNRAEIGLDFGSRPDYPLVPRKKSIIPAIGDSNPADFQKLMAEKKIYPVKDFKNVFYVPTTTKNDVINFSSTVSRIPVATDFAENFSIASHRLLPPRALTFPKLYGDILESSTSERVKSALLGINLDPVQYYPTAVPVDASDLLNPNTEPKVFRMLSQSIAIHRPGRESRSSIRQGTEATPIEVIKFHPGYLKVKMTAPSNGYLLYRDGFHPGWIGRVNGSPAELIRANYNQKAVSVKSGSNTVEFIFRPTLYLVALAIYCAATIAVAVFSAVFAVNSVLFRRLTAS